MNNQAYLFIMFVINGLLIGILFDVFRILRKSFKTTDFITYIEDIIFWILTGILILYFIFIYNNGEIRFYIFLGIAIGILLYVLTISTYIVKFGTKIITSAKNVILKLSYIIIHPFIILLKIIKKVLFRPISFTFINLRSFFTTKKKKLEKIIKKSDKQQKIQHN